MARYKNNDMFKGLSGRIGAFVFRTRGDTTYISRYCGARSRPPTREQEQVTNKFQLGVAYAKKVSRDPKLKALYQAADRKGLSAYNLALRDYCKPPQVVAIDSQGYEGLPGNIIKIIARDDFKVDRVKVSIYTAEDFLVEEGYAVWDYGFHWLYFATRRNYRVESGVIRVTAFDLPGNEGMFEKTI